MFSIGGRRGSLTDTGVGSIGGFIAIGFWLLSKEKAERHKYQYALHPTKGGRTAAKNRFPTWDSSSQFPEHCEKHSSLVADVESAMLQ
jgi:hypothetical protein